MSVIGKHWATNIIRAVITIPLDLWVKRNAELHSETPADQHNIQRTRAIEVAKKGTRKDFRLSKRNTHICIEKYVSNYVIGLLNRS